MIVKAENANRRNNIAVELGQYMLNPRISPDKKYLAYTSNWDEEQQMIYIRDVDSEEIYSYEIANGEYPNIAGWTTMQ